jgi:hypothetical protein
MRNHAFMLVTSAFVLAFGMAASAQQNPSGPTDQSQSRQQSVDHDRAGPMGGGMMGRGMMGGMGPGGMRPGMMGPESTMPPMMMRMIFALIDADGDGTISLQEFQAAHERIFKAMDANKDGKLELEEMQAFMHGMPAAPQQP